MEITVSKGVSLTQGERIALYLALNYSLSQHVNLFTPKYNAAHLYDKDTKEGKDLEISLTNSLQSINDITTLMYNMDVSSSNEVELMKRELQSLLKYMQQLESHFNVSNVTGGYRVYLDILHELAKSYLA